MKPRYPHIVARRHDWVLVATRERINDPLSRWPTTVFGRIVDLETYEVHVETAVDSLLLRGYWESPDTLAAAQRRRALELVLLSR